jgi:hypothetical protein
MAKKKPAARKPRQKKPAKPTPKKRGRPPKGTPDWAPAFLAALATSANVGASCQTAGIHPTTYHARHHADQVFAAACKVALDQAVDLLELEMRRRALHGVDVPVVYKGELCYHWVDTSGRPVPPDTEGGRLVPLVLKEYSDTLAIFLAKAHRPEKFRERVDVNHKGRVDLGLAETMSDDDLARIAGAKPV